jgi:hypothetical protein
MLYRYIDTNYPVNMCIMHFMYGVYHAIELYELELYVFLSQQCRAYQINWYRIISAPAF